MELISVHAVVNNRKVFIFKCIYLKILFHFLQISFKIGNKYDAKLILNFFADIADFLDIHRIKKRKSVEKNLGTVLRYMPWVAS